MFYYHWLIKMLLWPMAGQTRARWGSKTKCREKEGRGNQGYVMYLLKEKDARTLLGSHSLVVIHILIEIG